MSDKHSLFSLDPHGSDHTHVKYMVFDPNYHTIEFLQSDLARQINKKKVHLEDHYYKSYWNFQNLMIGEQYLNSDQAIKDPDIVLDLFHYNALDPDSVSDLNDIYQKYYDLNDLQFSSFIYYLNHETGVTWHKPEKEKAERTFGKAAKYFVETVLPGATKDHLYLCYR